MFTSSLKPLEEVKSLHPNLKYHYLLDNCTASCSKMSLLLLSYTIKYRRAVMRYNNKLDPKVLNPLVVH